MKSGLKLAAFAVVIVISATFLSSRYGSMDTLVVLLSLLLIILVAFALDAIYIMKMIKNDIKPTLEKISSSLTRIEKQLKEKNGCSAEKK